MKISQRVSRAFRGRRSTTSLLLEAGLRARAAFQKNRERNRIDRQPEVFSPSRQFADFSSSALLEHFRERAEPKLFSGFEGAATDNAAIKQHYLDDDLGSLLSEAEAILSHRWRLMGFGTISFNAEVNWLRDPISGVIWPSIFHGDVNLLIGGGSDVRVLWELNRLGHLIRLARAYAVTRDEAFAKECFAQIISWISQNPYGYGPNWTCAMEVALRAMNLIAAFDLLRKSTALTEQLHVMLLTLFQQHGRYIREHLEYSHVATSNHYLSDITGLYWLGLYFPELEAANSWKDFAWRELLREMDKQVLGDGADFESSTGYHRLVLELYLYTFMVCRENAIEISPHYSNKLKSMVEYVRAYLRPEGSAPLVGDTDSGQVLPMVTRAADDHAYLLSLAAVFFNEPRFKLPNARSPSELLWTMGVDGVKAFKQLPAHGIAGSQGFPQAGTYIMREGDLYLLFNASDVGLNGRGSHGHNDALSIELSACGCSFIIDPGTYVYTRDLHERHLFRSTSAHSTVQVDNVEQNTTDELTPFVMGNEARPQVVECELGSNVERITAEHYGYHRLSEPVTHRRTVTFQKEGRCIVIEDELSGTGAHELAFRFHVAPGLTVLNSSPDVIEIAHSKRNSGLMIAASGPNELALQDTFSSREYGAKELSISCCWTVRATLPYRARFRLVPFCGDDDKDERLNSALKFDV